VTLALVTGASRGIGRAVAIGLARDGCDCIAVYRSRADAAASLAAEIESMGRRCRTVALDVSDAAACEAILVPLLQATGTPDVLVNNAGVVKDGLFALMPAADWDAVLDTSLGGFYNVTRLVVRGMVSRRSGRIVTISSVAGLVGTVGQVNYAAAKAGLLGATRALARELGRYGITVNAVAPGLIDTDMVPPEAMKAILPQIPMGRMGTTEEVANVVRFLASPAASYVTGQTIGVNGGIHG
jgi:3-oxoacyl-[acyl-carrier protein] reductase